MPQPITPAILNAADQVETDLGALDVSTRALLTLLRAGGMGETPDPGPELTYGAASWSTPGSAVSFTVRGGWVFTVGGADLTVSALRHYGAVDGSTARVMIHRNSDNAVMATADITTVANDFAIASVTPVVLAAGVTYTVSARIVSGTATVYRTPAGLSYSSGFTLVNSGVFGGPDDNRPATNSSQVYVPPADFGFTL